MPGTIAGGKRAATTNKIRHGKDFYARIGSMGGKLGTTGGFAAGTICYCLEITGKHKKARCAGKLGGTTSRRGAKKK